MRGNVNNEYTYVCNELIMTREYVMKKRAEKQAETRRRIVEATIGLHSSVGPALTTFSMVAERAGVQRHTLYAHFPDDRSLLLACSGRHLERDPLPEVEAWRIINDPEQRLRTGLGAIYAWYQRNADLTAHIVRDAEVHPVTQEIVELRVRPAMASYMEVLGAGLTAQQRPVLALALSFHTWRTLSRDAGLSVEAAVDVMVRAMGSLQD